MHPARDLGRKAFLCWDSRGFGLIPKAQILIEKELRIGGGPVLKEQLRHSGLQQAIPGKSHTFACVAVFLFCGRVGLNDCEEHR